MRDSKTVIIGAVIILLFLGLAAGAYFAFFGRQDGIDQVDRRNGQNGDPAVDGQPPASDEGLDDLIQVVFPRPGATISSPLVVAGIARGSWYFEADFPVRLFDNRGNELAAVPAQAQGEWMTTEFVPFLATLEFDPRGATSGRLVFEKDNPSGLPENDMSLEMPVLFDESRMTIQVFFSNSVFDPEILDCSAVYPVGRSIPRTQAAGRAALEELLRGPTEQEREAGYITSLNPDVSIRRLEISDGTASVDFDHELERNTGGSCRVAAIRAQITETLKQFPTVDSVVISIDGRTEDILQP